MYPQYDPPPLPMYHVPRPRGRPPLSDRQRNRLTLKLPGGAQSSSAGAAAPGGAPGPSSRMAKGGGGGGGSTNAAGVRHELDEPEAQQLEEQFVLRVLPEMAVRFSKLVAERQIQEHLEIKFRDERNATVRFENKHYAAKLVDLPTITEAYRTADKKQLLKTADICQMLLVERMIQGHDDRSQQADPSTSTSTSGAGEAENAAPLARGLDIVYPDGISSCLRGVRKHRFRPRIPQSRIDGIEREVLRLLEDDAQAMAVKFEVCDDQLGGDDGRGGTPSVIDIMSPVGFGDLSTPMVADEDAASSVANEDIEFDENLAAELEQGLEELDDEEEEDSEDEDQPSNERAMQMKLLGEEIAELERTVRKKKADLDSAPNPIIRRR
ncbi:hypothetical protein LPJ72_005659, partial [Coemansia sp. Benny D160-2]